MPWYLIIVYILVVITVAVIIINTNSSSKALAYLMLIGLLPIAGIIIYFSVGINYRKRKLYKKKLEIDKHKYPLFEEKYKSFSQHLLTNNKEVFRGFYSLANSHASSLLNCCHDVELLINGEEKFPRLLADLQNAKTFIHLEYYIFENDETGNAVAEILIAKAKQGLAVRFIYDDFGSAGLNSSFINKLKNSGVEAAPFYKIKWWLFANRINYRNHRKIVVIDGLVGYIGGINISDKYNNANKKNSLFWRDTSVRLEGLAAANLQYIFLVDWNFCAGQNLAFSEGLFPYKENINTQKHLVQTVFSGPDSDYPNILFAMVQAICLCKKELLVTTPYFIPPATFMDAIKIAKLSGVEVKLLVPGISDSKLVNAISNSYYGELLEIGVEIYKYQKGFVHAKTMVCDDEVAFVGTTNLDHRSFELNFEVHEIIYDKTIASQLKAAFNNDILSSLQIDKVKWDSRSRATIFIERVLRLLSPLI